MIKALCIKNGNPLFVFGLSETNIQLLKDGKPIVVDLTDLGCSGGKVVITYGETEAHIVQELHKAGLLPPGGSQN